MNKQEIDWLLREKRRPDLRRDLERLRKGEPLAYVIGWVDFLGCKIDLSLKPLIPRPETEWWTEKAISQIAMGKSRIRVLDVFAGSGCIGIAILKHIPKAEVWFADNDSTCLKQIRINLKLNRIPPSRYKIKHSHILENVRMLFDCILANPPYIPVGRRLKLPLSIRKYEKSQALFGGIDGLKYIRQLFKEAKSRLRPGGELWLEFDSKQAAAIRKLARENGYICDIHNDQFHRPRYARCRNINFTTSQVVR